LVKKKILLRLIGIEPITFGTEIQRSIQIELQTLKKQLTKYTFFKLIKNDSTRNNILQVADNSGAKTVKCIKILGGYKKKYAKLGDIIVFQFKN
jgi:hypothetical protein